MFQVMVEALIEAVTAAVRWIGRGLRGAVVSTALDAGSTAAGDVSLDQAQRRVARRRVRAMAKAGDVAGLTRVYHRCGSGEHHRDLRIEALVGLARADATAAAPILREAISGPNDAWVVSAALDAAAKHGVVDLLDAVIAAQDDPRPAVAAIAASARKRLAKAAPPLHPQLG